MHAFLLTITTFMCLVWREEEKNIVLISLSLLFQFSNRADVVKYLLENGADIQTKDCDGQSPLHRAASLGSIDSVKMLVERGADVVAKV